MKSRISANIEKMVVLIFQHWVLLQKGVSKRTAELLNATF